MQYRGTTKCIRHPDFCLADASNESRTHCGCFFPEPSMAVLISFASDDENLAAITTPRASPFSSFGLPILIFIHFVNNILKWKITYCKHEVNQFVNLIKTKSPVNVRSTHEAYPVAETTGQNLAIRCHDTSAFLERQASRANMSTVSGNAGQIRILKERTDSAVQMQEMPQDVFRCSQPDIWHAPQ